MQREVVRRGAMVAVIMALVLLILATPGLIVRPTILSAIPALIIGLTDSDIVIDVHGAVDHYMYRGISLELRGKDTLSFAVSAARTDSYDVQVTFSRNATCSFDLYVLIEDRRGTTFALNATVFHGTDEGGDFVSMTDRATLRSVLARPPADVRALFPRGEGS